jgi:hypothetical protein
LRSLSRFFLQAGKHCSDRPLIFDLLCGLESGFPLCCILEWCFRSHVLKQRGLAARFSGIESELLRRCTWLNFVPCAWHRRKYVKQSYVPFGLLSDPVWSRAQLDYEAWWAAEADRLIAAKRFLE